MHLVITGNRSSGKSTILEIFKKNGFKVYNMDKVVHELYKKGQPGFEAIRKKIGAEFCSETEIDREKLKQWVLKSPKRMAKLNGVVQPLISQWIQWEKAKISTKNAVFELPVYFENIDYYKGLFNNVIYVIRDNPNNEFKSVQMPLSLVIDQVDFLIDNNGTIEQLKTKTLQLIKSLI